MIQAPRRHAERGSNFFLGFLFLPRPKREALKAVYSLCRYIDDIADSGNLSSEEARERLGFWRGEIGRLYEGKPAEALSERILPFVRRFRLPKQAFLDLIDGVEMDLDRT